MSAITIDRTGTRDGLLRLAMRADAVISGLAGVAGIPLAGANLLYTIGDPSCSCSQTSIR